MKHKWYAHSLEKQPIETWQPLTTHLLAMVTLAREFAAPFASEKWADAAGILHDLGKADSAFQGYLLRQNGLDDADYDAGHINHSFNTHRACEVATSLSPKRGRGSRKRQCDFRSFAPVRVTVNPPPAANAAGQQNVKKRQ